MNDLYNKVGDLRPNQLITTFGPGAIIDSIKDSVTVLDINYWKYKGKKINDTRLASYLQVDCFYSPRTTNMNDIPVVSFPYYHVCSNIRCSRLFDIRNNFDLQKYLRFGPTCPYCSTKAYPSRFLLTCEKGHLSDFPWSHWVHYGKTECLSKNLRLTSSGNTSTLADMWVECLDCGAKRSLSGATQIENFNEVRCSGQHPFRPTVKNEKCDAQIIPSQRGASNVYFPVIRSAISIPPWINPIYNLIDDHYRIIVELRKYIPDAEDKIYNDLFKDKYTRKEFDEAIKQRETNIKEFTDIKTMEYNAITHFNDPVYETNKKHFKAEEERNIPSDLSNYISRIINITRLREVMVLLGFTRVDAPDPDADEQKNITYLSKGKEERWLPAVEINGEGVFIEFNKNTLETWLKKVNVNQLSSLYADTYKSYCASRGWTVKYVKNVKYVLLHTFSHLLIKQMSLKSGYSSSAIKERIYCNDEMSGILLYTGSSDKEGSLGGLVELGKITNLIPIIKDAFEGALACTNDPECLHNFPHDDTSNGASCHSCCMVSETACENGNRMLDRGLVVPLCNRENDSYFKELVEKLCQLKI